MKELKGAERLLNSVMLTPTGFPSEFLPSSLTSSTLRLIPSLSVLLYMHIIFSASPSCSHLSLFT
jgi:hypothetical protein